MCFSVKDVCKSVKCGHGSCVVTSTAPFYECKCKPPYKPPNCRKGLFSWIFVMEYIASCWWIFFNLSSHYMTHNKSSLHWTSFCLLLQPLPAGPIPVRMGALAWRVPNTPPSSVLALVDTVESSVKLVNTILSLFLNRKPHFKMNFHPLRIHMSPG